MPGRSPGPNPVDVTCPGGETGRLTRHPVGEADLTERRARARLAEIVGADGVTGTGASTAMAREIGRRTGAARPWLTVRPTHTRQVEQILRWANETRTPIVPLSSSGAHVNGGSVPSAAGAVQIDLRAMNAILRVDRRHRLAIIEPGVTFGQLILALAEHGLRLPIPLLPRRDKSVIASLLDREPTTIPRLHWGMTEPLRSMEVVWGNGEKLYTGDGANRGDKDSDWPNGPLPIGVGGPAQLDYVRLIAGSQGTMAISTWASVKADVLPECQRLFFMPAGRLEDLLDLAYQLLRFRFGDELFIADANLLARVLARGADERRQLAGRLPRWCLVVGIGGGDILAREKLIARENDIRDMAERAGLHPVDEIPGATAEQMLRLLANPSPEPYWRRSPGNASREIFFLTTLDRTPGFVQTMADVGAGASERREFGVYLQPVHQGVGCHCEFVLPVDEARDGDADRIDRLHRTASLALFKAGAYFSRPYGTWTGLAFEADPATLAATRKVKDIFDPNHVMNPGKLCF